MTAKLKKKEHILYISNDNPGESDEHKIITSVNITTIQYLCQGFKIRKVVCSEIALRHKF